MKLAVRKEEGAIPLSGYHYMLHPIKFTSEGEAELFHMMGYVIITVHDEQGERLLREAAAALRHQCEVAVITERTLHPVD